MNLAQVFSEFKDNRSIDQPTMVRVLEDVFRTLIKKKYETDENFDVIVNQKGDLEMWRVRSIVPDGEVTDEKSQISISEALTMSDDYEIGEECYEGIYPEDFGRRSILAARQTLLSRIMEIEKDDLYRRYKDREGDFVVGEVNQILKRELVIFDDSTGHELILPRNEMIKGDFYHKGDTIRAVIKEVALRNNSPVIILSRTDNRFLERLMEGEVPEIEDGLITIKKIVRLPGERAKVAVESYDERIDPVGACVGMKGSRIHGIVRELRNENIDIINYTNNMNLFIQRSLTPAKVNRIEIDDENKTAEVYLDPDQVSLAIGKGGWNIRLASRITELDIDVLRDIKDNEEYDVDLDEFTDEIDDWIIDELKAIGCDTAKSVLGLSKEELKRRTDLEEETIDDVLKVLASEFEED